MNSICTAYKTLNELIKFVLIDEIYDTGKTFFIVNEYFKGFEYDYACLVSRYRIPDNNKIVTGKVLNHKKWIVFPWENG